jgi:hypothetical protein
MPAPVHLVTVVGGRSAGILPHTLRHYQALGIESFFVVLHAPGPDEAFVSRLSDLAASCGVRIEAVEVMPDFTACKDLVFTRIMQAHPDDWFLPIDCDELHGYPDDLPAILAHCERQGYDYVRGCFIDRLSADGRLTPLRDDESIWTQYPLGGFLTYSLLGGDPRKVVAAKGHVTFPSCGHHEASSGVGCPSQEILVPVHHFKWVSTLVPYLEERRDLLQRLNLPHWIESDRALSYFAQTDRIDLTDRRFLIGSCTPRYSYWDHITHYVLEDERRREQEHAGIP